ncbi:MAG: Dabb family protein [Gallionella sp.]|jgi:antibiotic biosynthesis monooxygenase (ABM) superfamily enzyme|nr:Dabb family protein [Gallionella sp.]
MFRHIVLVKWKPEATDAERQALRDAIEQLPTQVPEIIAARVGLDVGRGPNNYDMATVFDFEDIAAFKRYIASAAHQAYVQGPAKAVAQLAVVQHIW